MKFISFTSGSCGNCYYLGTEEGGMLIDAGASMRKVKKILAERGISLSDCRTILVTHDHLDHIRFLGSFCKYVDCRVFTPARLHRALTIHSFTCDHFPSKSSVLEPGAWNDAGPFSVRFFDLPHDATQTVGFAVRCEEKLFVLMTDLEHVTDEALQLAKEAETVVIESNYDYDMLMNGPYPQELKRRILQEGHLSNDDCAEAVKQFYHEGLRNLFLCHLSGNNNTPQKAYDCTMAALESIGIPKGSVYVRTLERGVASPTITL